MEIIIDNLDKFEGESIFGTFLRCKSIEVGASLGSGAFGIVYECDIIDGRSNSHLAIKILNDGDSGKAGFATALELQNRLLRKKNNSTIKTWVNNSEFLATPRFCFTGKIGNRSVFGFAMANLKPLGYIPFSSIIDHQKKGDNLRNRNLFLKKDDSAKFRIALNLSTAFNILSSVSYIHADINTQNLFINIQEAKVAIIDFDGGAIMEKAGDAPETFGKIAEGEFLAPEILDEISKHGGAPRKVKVSIHTDYWSVAVAIHFFFFLRGPYFFLKVLSRNEVSGYLNKYTWPNAGRNSTAVRQEALQPSHANYREVFDQFPNQFKEKMVATFNGGFSDPSKRTSFSQWETVLRAVLEVKPAIKDFRVTQAEIIEGGTAELSWEIENEYTTSLNGQDVSGTSAYTVAPATSTEYILTTTNIVGGSTSRSIFIKVNHLPKIIAFEATSEDIAEGVPAVFKWKTQHAESLYVNGHKLNKSTVSFNIVPSNPRTVYILKAENKFGETVSAPVVINVHKPPLLSRIWADRKALTTDDQLTVFWDAIRADEIEIKIRFLSGIKFVERVQVVAAKEGQQKLQLEATCDITCVALSKYGKSEIGGLRVDVVHVPLYKFQNYEFPGVPQIQFATLGASKTFRPPVVTPASNSVSSLPQIPDGFLRKQKADAISRTNFFIFCICLSLISAAVGYFYAISN